MLCKDCERLAKYANSDKTQTGICMRPSSWTPVTYDQKCLYEPEPYKCRDCFHYVEHDDACMTAEANDEICCGFEDKRYYNMVEILFDWMSRGLDYEELYHEAVKKAKAI